MTKFYSILVLALALLPGEVFSQADIPQADISNGILKARLYLPDSVNGYYRGLRFDWSGNMPSLEYKGHQYFGQWYTKYSPEINDAIMGPVEEFSSPDFANKKPGENFLKPGVGFLTKPDDKPYTFSRAYPVISRGVWKVKKKSDQVLFTHEVKGREYSYQYKKSIQLIKGKAEMVLFHTLKNTGRLPIETNVYNHNFFVIDKEPVGPGLIFTFPFSVSGEGRGIGDIAKLEGNQLSFLRKLASNENVYSAAIAGFGPASADYDIKLENQNTGAGVRITCDQPLLKLVFWSCQTTACAEPYIKVKIDPGQEFSWKINYEFYTTK